eukprot:TRINITY_DN9116_c0_g1_i1.p1 TRINITY_DN9116_c0_g1~~TRINITY_DN9116_c0_g1_i1.p1  ORF type:complete len:118 (-),score=13.59 TRINITY_DN9116_c0_g1_i1:28-381(-)
MTTQNIPSEFQLESYGKGRFNGTEIVIQKQSDGSIARYCISDSETKESFFVAKRTVNKDYVEKLELEFDQRRMSVFASLYVNAEPGDFSLWELTLMASGPCNAQQEITPSAWFGFVV